MTQRICILGATGSIGLNTLEVIAQHPDQFSVEVLTANTNVERLLGLCAKFKPRYVVLAQAEAAQRFRDEIAQTDLHTVVLEGESGLIEVTQLETVDKVMSAIVGAKGLLPTLSAIKAGKTVLIANKEPLVMAGQFMLSAAKEYGATVIPVDSEHNAIFQCLPSDYRTGDRPQNLFKIHLTASGGPFWDWDFEQFHQITPQMACQHPNWSMGPKITIDCATLMNKGLEVIEAGHLFQLGRDDIEVVIHRESIVHSLVEFVDGSYLAQMGPHDMRVAISHSLSWPSRMSSGAPRMDLCAVSQLNFCAPDYQKFPCLQYAFDAFHLGGAAPIVLNATNEVAVQAFLQEQVHFTQIPAIIESVLNKYYDLNITQFEDVLWVDHMARQYASEVMAKSLN